MSKPFAGLSLVMLVAALAACSGDPTAVAVDDAPDAAVRSALGQSSTEGALLAEIRRSTARYHRVEAAIADGYTFIAPCHYSAAGGKGYHYRKPALTDGVLDPAQPEILLYEPQANGTLKLVGVVFLIVSGGPSGWDATHSTPPTLGDQPFIDRRAPGSLGPPFPNYALFVSVWRHNPDGMYAQYNPTVSCEFAAVSVLE